MGVKRVMYVLYCTVLYCTIWYDIQSEYVVLYRYTILLTYWWYEYVFDGIGINEWETKLRISDYTILYYMNGMEWNGMYWNEMSETAIHIPHVHKILYWHLDYTVQSIVQSIEFSARNLQFTRMSQRGLNRIRQQWSEV